MTLNLGTAEEYEVWFIPSSDKYAQRRIAVRDSQEGAETFIELSQSCYEGGLEIIRVVVTRQMLGKETK